MTLNAWKIIFSIAILSLLIIALSGLFDQIGKQYTEASLSRALVTFGVARSLNAVISVAQGTEVAIEPAGIGVILTPGQILDPVNDLIERFSWVILASATSLGVQGLLLKIFSSPGFSLLVSISVLCTMILVWWRRKIPDALRNMIYRLTGFLLIIRFLIPVMAIAGEKLFTLFLEPEYITSSFHLTETRETISQLNKQSRNNSKQGQEISWFESLSRDFQSAMDSLKIDQHMDSLQNAVENLTEHTINLIVVFTLQTILFPLLFLWMAMKIIRNVFRMQFGFGKENY